MTEIDRIFNELVAIRTDLDDRLPRDDYDSRARLSWRRHELHAAAARLAAGRR